ncbi:MAG: hypothetical protein C0467_01465 [Planctomycetaceae bacterium]|nr:hypothetical protein [Planctomycetaceae bacterium]
MQIFVALLHSFNAHILCTFAGHLLQPHERPPRSARSKANPLMGTKGCRNDFPVGEPQGSAQQSSAKPSTRFPRVVGLRMMCDIPHISTAEVFMMQLNRREWLGTTVASLLPSTATASTAAKLPLGFSLYGMKSLSLAEALKVCRDCGYDGVELALMPGYHADPAKLAAMERRDLRKRLTESNLSVMGFMENLPILGDDAAQKINLERLKAAVELANTLVPDFPPPIETVLGGKPAEWDKVKERIADRLADWAGVGKAGKTVIAVKLHVANALHTSEDATWLVRRVNSEWLRLAFDYSHLELRGIALEDAVKGLIPLSVFVHVKDARGKPDKFEFLLPGEGTTDYAKYAKLLSAARYTGPVVVEVSGMVSSKANYDPVVAAQTSFRALSVAFGRTAKE